jgi:hypothetical protein
LSLLADLALTDYGGSVYEEAVVHTVIETPAFLASAADEGISEEERTAMVAYIAAHPTAGEIIQGTGGARKLRFAGRGKAAGIG